MIFCGRLIKAGALSKQHLEVLVQVSAWAEATGYTASIVIGCRKMAALSREISVLETKIRKARAREHAYVHACVRACACNVSLSLHLCPCRCGHVCSSVFL